MQRPCDLGAPSRLALPPPARYDPGSPDSGGVLERLTAPLRPDDPDRAHGVVLNYSGGCDSTLAACRLAQHFPKVHLVTYLRFGFLQTDNPDVHAERMRRRFP